MSDIDEFAINLLEESKRFLEKASESADVVARNAYLHASLMLAFCSLEAHLNAIAFEFSDRPEISVHEKGILLEKDVKLDSGEFVLGGFRISRLEDKLLLLHRIFSGKPLEKTAEWWSKLKAATDIRNKLTHPKAAQPITLVDARDALAAIISSIDELYKAIYKKGFPAAKMALDSHLNF